MATGCRTGAQRSIVLLQHNPPDHQTTGPSEALHKRSGAKSIEQIWRARLVVSKSTVECYLGRMWLGAHLPRSNGSQPMHDCGRALRLPDSKHETTPQNHLPPKLDMASPWEINHQILNGLSKASLTITTHDEVNQQAKFVDVGKLSRPVQRWHDAIDDNSMAFYSLYTTTKAPVDTQDDLEKHTKMMDTSPGGPPLVVEKGTVCRMVDFAPGYTTVNHRSLSIDYGVVIFGEIELILDSGEVECIKPGGMIVQRGTMHKWRNPSASTWTRMFFVLVAAEPRVVGGQTLQEDLGGL